MGYAGAKTRRAEAAREIFQEITEEVMPRCSNNRSSISSSSIGGVRTEHRRREKQAAALKQLSGGIAGMRG